MARLLLADDDPEQLAIWKLLLEASGHEVHIAATEPEAAAALEGVRPDIFIVDLRMPGVAEGLRLIRAAGPTKVIVLSGWPADLDGKPEEAQAARVFLKPVHVSDLLTAIQDLTMVLLLLLVSGATISAQSFRFTVDRAAEVIADMEMASPGSDWSRAGREAALVNLAVDGRTTQNVMLYSGEARHTYSAFLGELAAGEHELRTERNAQYSARDAGLKVWSVRFRQVPRGDPNWLALAHAPILYARADTVGGFSDVPLIAYCERLVEEGRPVLQYTTIFSNEDGGTSTRALMARWGRTTDIEYIYRAWLHGEEVERATIQAKDHKEIEFEGRREGAHPVLIPSTRNNMVAAEGRSAIRYQVAPLVVELSRHSREQVMDERPFSYRVMAQELVREGKLRPFGTLEGENISDPRNYLYMEEKLANQDSALATLVRVRGENFWRSSHLGRVDYAISRDGWIRTTIELPPGTRPEQIEEVGFECHVIVDKPQPLAGHCTLQALSKMFLLDSDYRPGRSIWSRGEPVAIPSGHLWVARLH